MTLHLREDRRHIRDEDVQRMRRELSIPLNLEMSAAPEIVAIACEIAQQRIASPEDIDAAVKAGLGYPLGPLSMGDRVGASTIAAILDGMHAVTQDPRYRPSPWLRRRALLGLSLRHGD